jgi:hypothetical protein
VEKVLDVENGARCFVVGIVYVDNPLKPSILDEVNQEVSSLLLFFSSSSPFSWISSPGAPSLSSAFDFFSVDFDDIHPFLLLFCPG